MPREKTFYYCNICDVCYHDKNKAEECENSHFVAKNIKKVKYNQDYKVRYPDSILIEMENGKGEKKEIRYFRRGV